jgi:hypothetical protein
MQSCGSTEPRWTSGVRRCGQVRDRVVDIDVDNADAIGIAGDRLLSLLFRSLVSSDSDHITEEENS